jgi:cytochrome bd-type quinol oxidase subunit 2
MAGLIYSLLVYAGLIVAGGFASHRQPEATRRVARGMAALALVTLALLVVTGLMRPRGTESEIHRWGAHLFVMFLSMGLAFSWGVLLQSQLRSRPWATSLRSLALFACAVVAMLASVTGYLGPGHDPTAAEESHNRFVVLHAFMLPTVLGLLLVAWWRSFTPPRTAEQGS